MTKKLTITVSNEVYRGLYQRVGRRKISRLIDGLAREHLRGKPLAQEYAEAAADENTERDALEWMESGVAEAMVDEDFSGWPGYPAR
jgi:predicted CopG family antitoxin